MEKQASAAAEFVKVLAEFCAAGLEALGIVTVVLITLFMTGLALLQLVRGEPTRELFIRYRHGVIRGILLSLEFLVAADIIRTVSVEFSLHSVATLAILVLIRTFLSFTLDVELHGRWPWQSGEEGAESR